MRFAILGVVNVRDEFSRAQRAEAEERPRRCAAEPPRNVTAPADTALNASRWLKARPPAKVLNAPLHAIGSYIGGWIFTEPPATFERAARPCLSRRADGTWTRDRWKR